MWAIYRNLAIALGVAFFVVPGVEAKRDLYAETLSQIRHGDYALARYRLVTLAKRGHSQAQFQLGLMYHRGKGVPQNYRKATKWYRIAADSGDTSARNNLGIMYRDGLGVPKNEVLAYMWFSLGASEEVGNGLSRKNRDRLSRNMSAEDILQAQQLAEEYAVGLMARNKRWQAEVNSPAAPKNASGHLAPVKLSSAIAKMVPLPAAKPPAMSAPVKIEKFPPPPAASSPDTTPTTDEPEAKSISIGTFVSRRLPQSPVSKPAPAPPEKKIAVAALTKPDLAKMQTTVAALDPDPADDRQYLIQLGLFRKPSNVQRLRTKLTALGIGLQVKEVSVRGRHYRRLRIGPYKSEEKARAMESQVNNMFHIKSLLIPTPY